MRKALFVLLLAIACASHAAGGRVFVSNERDDTVSVIDAATNEVIATVPVGKRPRGVGVSPDGSEVYVAISGDNAIAVVDPDKLEVVRTFDSGDDPEAFAVHPNGNIYISNEEDATATFVELASGRIINEVELGEEPEGVLVTADGSTVFVASEAANLVHVIDTESAEIKADVLLKATKVDGVFTADPMVDPDARPLSRIGYLEVIERRLRVMDTTAITLCMENGLPIVVFNIRKPGNILRIVRGERVGSVVSESGDE